ncbi:MAG TPA: asparagine synthase (glutamine-hydrolyzing) [Acidobacteria bacterium]|nr:asparagine synthase (glutamine-hydrolyzing) [Acidobacteriota bacterium]
MCGIAGIVERDQRKPISSERLLKMVRVLTHRGPDDEGYVGLPGVGLAMRRLAIVDVDGGHQPFKSEDGEIHLVANGEIYNHLELRKMLIAHGHCFRSESDIEVLVHAYEQWGTSFLERVHGMFAVALWDGRQRIFFAARDRAGEKPLYYAATNSTLIFASEIKGILASGMVERDVDLEALDQFLTYEYVITPRTIFSKIRRLPAAHYLVYRDGQLETCRYWDAAAVAPRHWKEDEAAEAVREVFAKAVSRQMMSDVPLGAFLSGGIDSSAVVAMMVEASGGDGSAVNTFSMGFADGSYNELPYARTVASRFKTTHREGTVEPDLRELFDQLIVHLDEPFADVSLFPTYMVSKMARQHVTVALSGDGGDEIFGGYDTYAADQLARRLATVLPKGAVSMLAGLVGLLPASERKKGLLNKVKRFVQGIADEPEDIAHYRWMAFLPVAAKQALYTPELQTSLFQSDVYRPIRESLGSAGTDDLLHRQLYADLCVYLADDILVKVDRMSMATSLETRAPFLDVNLMELAYSIPSELKIRNGERKYILKQALRDVLPTGILRRPKEGFSIPMKNWLRGDLAPIMRDLLAPERIGQRGWFSPVAVTRLIDSHLSGRDNHAHVLFSLMVLERWAESVLDEAV